MSAVSVTHFGIIRRISADNPIVAESVNAIVVHAKVRKHIEDRGIAGMTFYGPDEWAG